YIDSRPAVLRWRDRLIGRRYQLAWFPARAGASADTRPGPVVVIAHSFLDATPAYRIAATVEQDWPQIPANYSLAYDEILQLAPQIIVVQLRKTNLCGCLAHRHLFVREPAFTEAHESLGNATV